MTGDGRPDTLLLEARGRQPDDLDVTFTIRGAGRELFRDEWNTADQFAEEERPSPGQHVSSDSLAHMVRREMNAFFAPSNFESAARLPFEPHWPPMSSDCDGDPRNCVAFYLRYERAAAARARQGQDSTPPAGLAYAAFINRVDHAAFDTGYVRRIGEDMRQRRLAAFTFAYGYETTRTITWSALAGRFFPVFECC